MDESYIYHEAMKRAVELSRLAPSSEKAFSVGALIVDENGAEIATGYSRETDATSHAEEVAIMKARRDMKSVRGATLVSSMEPCGDRASKPNSCAELIIATGIKRVVYGYPEPSRFVEKPRGASVLASAGVLVIAYPMR